MNIPTQKRFKNIGQFRIAVLEQMGVSFCTRNHFGRIGVDEKEHFSVLSTLGSEFMISAKESTNSNPG
ncbi:MAG: hypothetical protein QF563_01060 [Candidatus Marinimicrobia bacterium]|nr:hypothetical protein [Candidatus Neomarinimicrobiota bacterium]